MARYGLVIHGGAGTIRRSEISPEREKEYRADLEKALAVGYAILDKGGRSVDAVAAAIVVLEDSPLFNAGKGAVLTSAGTAELDASIMDGKTLGAGAVAGVKKIKNPILASRSIMEKSPHILLAGPGAEAFAKEQRLDIVSNKYFITERRREQLRKTKAEELKKLAVAKGGRAAADFPIQDGFGTVGAVALDQHGDLAAGTSTGGRVNKAVGRVGDSPIIGAGNYANNRTCAVSGTGHGEFFMRTLAAHDVSALMEYRGMSISDASVVALRKIAALGGDGGIIAIDAKGNIALPFNTAGMYRGYKLSDGQSGVAIFGDAKK